MISLKVREHLQQLQVALAESALREQEHKEAKAKAERERAEAEGSSVVKTFIKELAKMAHELLDELKRVAGRRSTKRKRPPSTIARGPGSTRQLKG